MKTLLDEHCLRSSAFIAATKAFNEGRLEFNAGDRWVAAGGCPDYQSDFNLYRVTAPPADGNHHSHMNLQDGNPPVNPTRYTKELHLQHVQAFWEGNLEWQIPSACAWEKAVGSPSPIEDPSNYRIASHKTTALEAENERLKEWIRHEGVTEGICTFSVLNEICKNCRCPRGLKAPAKQLRPWKPEEIPLGAWIREKNHQATSLIVAQMQGFIVWYAISGERVAGSPENCLNTCEHSTDNGKTWIPCGVSE